VENVEKGERGPLQLYLFILGRMLVERRAALMAFGFYVGSIAAF